MLKHFFLAAFFVCLSTIHALSAPAAAQDGPPQAPGAPELSIQIPSTPPPPPSKNGFIIAPKFYYSHNDALNSNTGMSSGSGHATGGGFVAIAQREFTDWLTLGFMYSFTYMKYDGGGMLPDVMAAAGFSAHSEQDATSHGIGLLADINLAEYGQVQLSVNQGFTNYGGDIATRAPDGSLLGKNSCDSFSDRVTELIGWYIYNWNVSESWTLSPYAGWRSTYVDLKNIDGMDGVDNHDWAHFISGGLMTSWNFGLFGLNARAGVNHRLTNDDIPGFAFRALSPGVVVPGWNVNMEPTVLVLGAGFHYVIPGFGVIFGGYDGFLAEDTMLHTGGIGINIPF